MKHAAIGFAVCYLLAAAVFSAAVGRTIPAVNTAGALYYGIVWPVWPLSVALGFPAPIPEWAFTFHPDSSEEKADG